MAADENAGALLAAIEAKQARLREMLAGKDSAALAQRPASGKWSALENVRHLLFAEQAHLGRFIPGGVDWSPLGLAPRNSAGEKRLQALGGVEAPDVADVLAAWEAAHAAAKPFLDEDSERVRKAMDGNLRHLRAHLKVIERLLR